MPLALLLALLISVVAPPDTTLPARSHAAVADTTDSDISIRPLIIPSGFYSPTRGFGIGAGVEIENVVAPGLEFQLTAQVMQRFRRYRASLFTGDRFESRLFVGVLGEYFTNEVRGYYGLGPQTSRANKVFVHIREVEGELRIGWHPLGQDWLRVQPVVRLLHTRVLSFRDRREDAFVRLDETSQRALFSAVDRPATGVTYGLEVALDGRDRPFYSTRGALLLLTGRRYDGLDDRPFRHYTGTASAFGFLPVTGRHVLFARAVVASAWQIGDEPLPYFALPVLDDDLIGAYPGHRFIGNDVLAISAGYRFPIFTLFDWYGLDGHISVSAANAYDNLLDQFKPGITFSDDLSDEGDRTPLRPSLAVGGSIVNLDRGRVIIGGQVGIDPEGLRLATLQFVYEHRARRPIVR